MATKKAPVRRSAEIEAEILSRIAAGETLARICSTPELPTNPAVLAWVLDDPAFAERYARARSIGLEVLADEILSLADICRTGERTKVISGGVDEDGNALPDRVEVITADMVERAKLQIESRKWLLARLKPAKYGDRVTLAGDRDAPVVTEVLINFVGAIEGRPVSSARALPACAESVDSSD